MQGKLCVSQGEELFFLCRPAEGLLVMAWELLAELAGCCLAPPLEVHCASRGVGIKKPGLWEFRRGLIFISRVKSPYGN